MIGARVRYLADIHRCIGKRAEHFHRLFRHQARVLGRQRLPDAIDKLAAGAWTRKRLTNELEPNVVRHDGDRRHTFWSDLGDGAYYRIHTRAQEGGEGHAVERRIVMFRLRDAGIELRPAGSEHSSQGIRDGHLL